MSDRSWKDHLLSSGVPLEYSVLRTLADLGIINPAEHRYERPNEQGVSTEFSIDVCATDIDTDRNVWLELLIECKYRHDNTRWVFAPVDYQRFERASVRDAYVVLDDLAEDRRFDFAAVETEPASYPMCGGGIELLPKDGNPKSIKGAISQLQFALVDKVVDAMVHQADHLLGQPTPIFFFVPMLVTTADLWRLRPGTTIENIRDAQDIANIADSHQLLLVHQRPHSQVQRHTEVRLRKLDERHRMKLDEVLAARGLGFNWFVEGFASSHPSVFFVVNYKQFRQATENLLRFVRDENIVVLRDLHLHPDTAG